MSDHGTHFDEFAATAASPHGGATFDAGFGLQAGTDTRGKLFDLFGKPAAPELRGEHYDDFEWRDMPALHGHLFDSDYEAPTALAGGQVAGEHATWFDAFRGGAFVRYQHDGAEYEGVIIDCNREFATVKTNGGADGGGRHEVYLGQILKWREASAAATLADSQPHPTAEPGTTDTSVVGGPQGERPSGESSAMGGGERTSVDPELDKPSISVKIDGKDLDVGKSVDSTETAVQGETHDGDSDDGRHAYCKHCGHTCRKPRDGKCPTCGGRVTIKKTVAELADVAKRLREVAGV